MDHDHCLIGRLIQVEHDLLDEDAQQALFGPRVGAGRVSGGWEIVCEVHQRRSVDPRTHCGIGGETGDALLELGDALERSIPPRLQLSGEVALGRIDHVLAARRQRGVVARLRQFAAQRLADFVTGPCGLVCGPDGSLDGMPGDGFQRLCGHSLIDAHAANADAPRGADVAVVAPALVAVDMAGLHAVGHRYRPAAAPAAHEAGQ